MKSSDIFWRIINLLVLLITIVVPAYVTYDTLDKGTVIPEKKVSINLFGGNNALRDLSKMGDRFNFNLTVDKQKVNNLVVSQATLKNVGKSPIIPSDYIEPISITVKKPWKIVSVNNWLSTGLQFNWIRVSDNKYIANPALINPGDMSWIYIYLTNTDSSGINAELPSNIEEIIKWDARIINLRSFSKNNYEELDKYYTPTWGIVVNLFGWSAVFVLVCMPLFLILYLYLLQKTGILIDWSLRSYIVVFVLSILSLTASESMATYLFGTYLTLIGVNHWLNAPPILIHSICLIYLWIKAKNIDKES